MARMAETRSPEEGGAAAEEWRTCSSGWEQSGQSQSRRVEGGMGRHGMCQGVAQVRQDMVSVEGGLCLQSMQRPSESHGSCLLGCAIWFDVTGASLFSSLLSSVLCFGGSKIIYLGLFCF